MAPTTTAPKLSKKRKLGKGKKKAWRVADVEDIQDFLDDERRQKETGGIVSEKTDETLFFIDKSKVKKVEKLGHTRVISKEERRKRPLRSTAFLSPNNHIKSVLEPLKEDFRKGKRSQKILDSIQERCASQVKVVANQQRHKFARDRRTERRAKCQMPETTSDIWNDDEDNAPKVKRPRHMMGKPSKLSATIVPHPGASTNPTYEDHQELLHKAWAFEDKQEKREKQETCAFKLPPKKDRVTAESHLAEMSAGLIDDSDSESEEEDVKEEQENDVTPSVRVLKRKSKRQKRAETELKVQMRKKKDLADKNRREYMVNRIRCLKSEIKKEEEYSQVKVQAKLKKKEDAPFKTKRLGKHKFEEPSIEVKLPEQLVPSLRQLKPEGHVLDDVYKQMLRRNILEPRLKIKNKPKYKRKTYIKRSHKEIS